MSQSTAVRNPFMLMLDPEAVLAAVEKSERLGALNRHLCRPLDRGQPTPEVEEESRRANRGELDD